MDPDLLNWIGLGSLAIIHAGLTLVITALREVSNARLEEMLGTEEQVTLFRRLLQDDDETLDNLSILRGGVLTLTGVLLGWSFVGQPLAWTWGLLFAGALFILLFFAHVLPRTFGDRFAEGVVITLFPTVWRILWIAQVFTRPFRWLALISLRIAGLSASEDAAEEADDEIRSAALEALRDGVLEKTHLEMIEKVIDFRDVEVTEVMTPRIDIIGIDVEDSFDKAVELFTGHGLSRLPIYEESIDKIIGIVHIKDALESLNRNGSEPPSLRDILRKPLFVPESKRVGDLFGDIKRDKVHVAIVVDEYGGTAGIVTMYDIVTEILGDIDDEHDDAPERTSIQRLGDGHFSVEAKLHIDELNENLSLAIPEDDDYDTLGGYLSTQLGRIPSVGDTHRHEEVLFRVLEGDERKVDRIEIQVESPEAAAQGKGA